MAHPPVRGHHWMFTRPLVHVGFLKSWLAGGLNEKVVGRIMQLVNSCSAHTHACPFRIYVTGNPRCCVIGNPRCCVTGKPRCCVTGNPGLPRCCVTGNPGLPRCCVTGMSVLSFQRKRLWLPVALRFRQSWNDVWSLAGDHARH